MRRSLRIPEQQLRKYQQRYDDSADLKLDHIRREAMLVKRLTVEQLYEIALWKSRRRAELTKNNPNAFVREITSFSFASKYEESRMGSLLLLQGVQHPTASVILHFCVDASYPILDFRAIWSLGLTQPIRYTINYWVNYIEICRTLAAKHQMSVRELDMALWQYSKEHQNTPSSVSLT